MANEYVSQSVLKATLGLANETYANADIDAALTSASRALDEICERRFFLDSVDATRYYSRVDRDLVRIDDLVTLTTLKTDPNKNGTFSDTWTLDTDFILEPLNAATESPAKPYMLIRRLPGGSYSFPTGPKRVQLIGKFGWAAVPAQIVEATGILATQLLRRAREAPFGIIGFGADGDAVRIARTDPQITLLLTGLHRSSASGNAMGLY